MKDNNYTGSIFIFFIILFTVFKIDGFTNPLAGTMNEIEKNNFVDCIGIDYIDSDSEEKWRVAVVFPDLKSNGEEKQQSETRNKNELLSAEGKTVFETHRKLHLLTPRNLLYNHAKWILVGESAAKASLLNSLEFEMRDVERGWYAKVAIVKDIMAEQFIASSYKKDEHYESLLTGFRESADNLSVSDEVTFIDLFIAYDKNDNSFCVPYFILNKEKYGEKEDDFNIMHGGLAVIKDNKLFQYLSKEQSRGVNWVAGNIKSCSIVVKDTNNMDVSLEVLKAHSDIKTKLNGDKPEAEIKVYVKSQLNELLSDNTRIKGDYIVKLEEAQNQFIKSEIESILLFAQENMIDIFDIDEAFYHQHPIKWKLIENNWDLIFQGLDIKISVQLL